MLLSISFAFGLIIGSFLNAAAWRLPRNLHLGGRSQCVHCARTLGLWDLWPVISWCCLRARCRYCKKSIHWRYPFVELMTGLLFALAASVVSPESLSEWLQLLHFCLAIAIAVLVFIIDVEHYLILDKVVLWGSAGIVSILVLTNLISKGSFWQSSLGSGLVGAASVIVILWLLWRISGGKWLGFGDVKFMLPFGLSLGFPGSLIGLGLASIIGAVFGVLLMIMGKATWASRLPFGAFLTLAWIIILLFGDQLWQLYWNYLTSF